MIEKLRKLLDNSKSPFFNYNVAVIIKCSDGNEFIGVNVETSSQGSGCCAERNALFNAIAYGYNKEDFEHIYIMNRTDDPCYPCFICRQALYDYCNKDIKITTYSYDGSKEDTITLEDLTPYAFGIDDLK